MVLRAVRRRLVEDRDHSRDSHGGQGRIKAARFPARTTIEEFDFAFQSSLPKNTILHLGQLDFLHGKENVVLLGPLLRLAHRCQGRRRVARRFTPARQAGHCQRPPRLRAGVRPPVSSGRWRHLASAGANFQRPLWASTGVKDPNYPATVYIDELVGVGTVTTVPDAFRTDGLALPTLHTPSPDVA